MCRYSMYLDTTTSHGTSLKFCLLINDFFLLTPPKPEIFVKIPCHVHRLMDEVFLAPFPGNEKHFKSLGFIRGI